MRCCGRRQQCVAAARRRTVKIYQGGGSVRDELLGLPVVDRDGAVVGATPDERGALGYRPVGKDFPVFLQPDTREEYALARTERKTAPGYKGFVVHAAPDVTLEDDLRRRDLTINAMARDAAGTLIDPFGGAADLAARRLRHVSPAFSEDPVRILRVARFAARCAPLGFEIVDDTLSLMRAMVAAGEVDALVPERVWAELVRALAEPRPAQFFEVLRARGALRRPDRFELVLLACEADATGRPGFAARGYPQAAVWRALRGAAAATDAGARAAAGRGGEALIAAIRRERINAIRKVRIQEGLREDDTLG